MKRMALISRMAQPWFSNQFHMEISRRYTSEIDVGIKLIQIKMLYIFNYKLYISKLLSSNIEYDRNIKTFSLQCRNLQSNQI